MEPVALVMHNAPTDTEIRSVRLSSLASSLSAASAHNFSSKMFPWHGKWLQ